MKLRKIKTVLLALGLFASLEGAHAEGSPWVLRMSASSQFNSVSDGTGMGLKVDDMVVPDLGVGYFFTPNIAAALSFPFPLSNNTSNGDNGVGSLSQVPSTLTMQYHFPMSGYKPYLGAGIAVTKLGLIDVGTEVLRSSSDLTVGPTIQVGVDIPIKKDLYFNIDVKKMFLNSDIKSSTGNVGNLKIDPLVVGVGLGMNF